MLTEDVTESGADKLLDDMRVCTNHVTVNWLHLLCPATVPTADAFANIVALKRFYMYLPFYYFAHLW